ncbi:histone-like nucleoid-structuring protein Lsr2 [Streptomyces sp. NPDC047453]|uniref:Lsr2 family DNA-binding protein n=1 Tax=Streptomyces sp. NPDC047453 TaxID=3154812 RepID=UPI00340CAC1B
MTTAPALRPTSPAADVHLKPVQTTEDPEQLPVGKLLAWGDQHADPDVQDQAARARIALHGLRQRYATDRELTELTSEAEKLEQRLAELRAREAELAPAKKAKGKRQPAEYPAATVRAWAKENNVDCPQVGRVPKKVVEAWRQATGAAAGATS